MTEIHLQDALRHLGYGSLSSLLVAIQKREVSADTVLERVEHGVDAGQIRVELSPSESLLTPGNYPLGQAMAEVERDHALPRGERTRLIEEGDVSRFDREFDRLTDYGVDELGLEVRNAKWAALNALARDATGLGVVARCVRYGWVKAAKEGPKDSLRDRQVMR